MEGKTVCKYQGIVFAAVYYILIGLIKGIELFCILPAVGLVCFFVGRVRLRYYLDQLLAELGGVLWRKPYVFIQLTDLTVMTVIMSFLIGGFDETVHLSLKITFVVGQFGKPLFRKTSCIDENITLGDSGYIFG